MHVKLLAQHIILRDLSCLPKKGKIEARIEADNMSRNQIASPSNQVIPYLKSNGKPSETFNQGEADSHFFKMNVHALSDTYRQKVKFVLQKYI